MKTLFTGLSGLSIVLASTTPALAQTGSSADVQLEEIVITAERRTEDLQKVGASVVALQGADLQEQGRITTAQILETVPNVTFTTNRGADNPNGNITIRGVQSTQTTGGDAGPSATATYVDDIYQGIGGNYDISRVEVLRGPQGTLYGRSATGGVVAFHTNDPDLTKLSTELSGEYGTAALRNGTIAVNIPFSDVFAIRVAGHQVERHGYWSSEGGASSTQEARIKALYQPFEQLKILLSLSTGIQTNNSGGNAPTLVLGQPDTINYTGTYTTPSGGAAAHTNQYAANVNYDFGWSNLTYVGSIHTYETHGRSGPTAFFSGIQSSIFATPLDQFNTQELRLASNNDGKLRWLVGGSFYSNLLNHYNTAIQNVAYLPSPGNVVDTTAGTTDAVIFTSHVAANTKDYGIFTEETYSVTDTFRLTAGLRYDKTKVRSNNLYDFNTNLDPYVASLTPETFVHPSAVNKADFSNTTYKLRAEFDLSPSNMIYAMTSTGFLPGDAQLSPVVDLNFQTGQLNGISFATLPFNQEKLTSYEVGSKNRFLNGALQLNGDVFYYNYEGYQEAANTAPAGSPVPQFLVLAVPVRMYGAELDAAWALTDADRVSLTGGWLDAKIKSYPDLPGSLGNTKQYLPLERIPGIPRLSATGSYEHNFTFGNGSKLTPRAEVRYTGAYYVTQPTQAEVNFGVLPYDHQSAYAIYNAALTWSSPSSAYSATVYGRNLSNEIYKSALTLSAGRTSLGTDRKSVV